MEEYGSFASNSRIPRAFEDIELEDIKLKVFPSVFCPREETLFWVRKAFTLWTKEREKKDSWKGLDIFCGTGILGIYFLEKEPSLEITFSDISILALYNTRYNLEQNNLLSRARIVFSNIFSSLWGEKFDLVLANPPYVAQERLQEVDEEVLSSEPLESWWGGREGLEVIERFIAELPEFLFPKGIAFMEVDPFQVLQVRKFLEPHFKVKVLRDQFRRQRVIVLKKT